MGSQWHPNTTQKSHLNLLRRSFLLKNISLSTLHESRYKNYLNYECESYLKFKSLLLTATRIIDLPFKLSSGRPSQTLEIIKLYHFLSFNIIEKEANFVLKCPLYNSIKEVNFLPYFIMYYYTISSFLSNWTIKLILASKIEEASALCYSMPLTILTTSWCISSPVNHLASWDLKSGWLRGACINQST